MSSIIIEKNQIKSQVKYLANRLNASEDKPDVIVCVLSGGFFFFSDLVRLLTFDFEIEFVKDNIFVNNINLTGKRVLVIEDIFDSGKTVKQLNILFDYKMVKERHFAALLARNTFVQESNMGFLFNLAIKGFVYGYGLDDRDGKKRNLEDIYIEE